MFSVHFCRLQKFELVGSCDSITQGTIKEFHIRLHKSTRSICAIFVRRMVIEFMFWTFFLVDFEA